jgi:hypothetical protein
MNGLYLPEGALGVSVQVSGVSQFAHSLEAGKLGSQEAGDDEALEPSSIQAFQPSSYFTETHLFAKPDTQLRPEAIWPKLSGRDFAFFNWWWSNGLRYDCLLILFVNAVKTRGRAGVGLTSDVGK